MTKKKPNDVLIATRAKPVAVHGLWAVTERIFSYSDLVRLCRTSIFTNGGRGYKITHIPTGMAATEGATLKKAQARKLCKALGDSFPNWAADKPFGWDGSGMDPDVGLEIQKIIKEHTK